MKKLFFLICYSYILLGCNMSDDVVELPGGHQYVIEGRCANRLLISLDSPCNFIEPVKECKYNDDFICTVSTDSISCNQDKVPIDKKKYTVIDVHKKKVYCLMSKNEYDSFWKKYIHDDDLKLE